MSKIGHQVKCTNEVYTYQVSLEHENMQLRQVNMERQGAKEGNSEGTKKTCFLSFGEASCTSIGTYEQFDGYYHKDF